ncbi:MAG: hypothetical protein QM766_01260 [Burkholderiaceae bacterium]
MTMEPIGDGGPVVDPLSRAILQVLAAVQGERAERAADDAHCVDASAGGGGAGVSVTRIAKRLGLGASVVLRQLTLLGDARLGGRAGPGWVRVVQRDGRWLACLTDEGRRAVASFNPAC